MGSAPQTRNDHRKMGQFLKTGIRKPASEERGSQVPEEVWRFTSVSFHLVSRATFQVLDNPSHARKIVATCNFGDTGRKCGIGRKLC